MKKAIIVKYDLYLGVKKHDQANDQATEQLNQMINDGWNILQMCPMSGNNHGQSCVCIVVLEK